MPEIRRVPCICPRQALVVLYTTPPLAFYPLESNHRAVLGSCWIQQPLYIAIDEFFSFFFCVGGLVTPPKILLEIVLEWETVSSMHDVYHLSLLFDGNQHC